MTDEEQTIIDNHNLRLGFRKELLSLVTRYLATTSTTDVIAELGHSYAQVITFKGCKAYEDAKKKQAEEEGIKHE